MKGVWLGADQKTLTAILPHAICKAMTPRDDSPSTVACDSTNWREQNDKRDSYACRPAYIWYSLYHDRVVFIDISGFPSSQFQSIVATMSTKYGSPVTATGRVAEDGGQAVDQSSAEWTDVDGDRIHFVNRTLKNPTLATLEFESADLVNWRTQRTAEREEAATREIGYWFAWVVS